MTSQTDTIAAIATPPGRGGIGIVRLSGAQAPDIGSRIIGRTLEPRRATYAAFVSATGETLDRGVAIHFAAPHSYTGEHVLELHGHGGPAVLALVLERCLECGARRALPGEFTQRAFLNGKLDLVQAEAVADLIDAGSTAAARAATRSLCGEFSARIHALADQLLELRALTEAALDFPEEDIDFVRAADAERRVREARDSLDSLVARARRGALLRDGITLALVGRPNVGKSSLMNRLAGEDVAIVTEIAGTTRDALRTHVEIQGVPVTVIDTAGLRASDDPIERIGIDRTWEAVARAAVVLLIRDARDHDDAEVRAEERAIEARLPRSVARIVVLNKIDLLASATSAADRSDASHPSAAAPVEVSALTGEGLPRLEQAVLDAVGAEAGETETAFSARSRHLEALAATRSHLQTALDLVAASAPALEVFAEELRLAHDALGSIVGETSADDVLGAIFARFCIGK